MAASEHPAEPGGARSESSAPSWQSPTEARPGVTVVSPAEQHTHSAAVPADAHATEVAVPHERPEDWGWHAEMGKWARYAGWVAAVMLAAMFVGNHEGHISWAWLAGTIALLVILLLRDIRRRRNAWRD